MLKRRRKAKPTVLAFWQFRYSDCCAEIHWHSRSNKQGWKRRDICRRKVAADTAPCEFFPATQQQTSSTDKIDHSWELKWFSWPPGTYAAQLPANRFFRGLESPYLPLVSELIDATAPSALKSC